METRPVETLTELPANANGSSAHHGDMMQHVGRFLTALSPAQLSTQLSTQLKSNQIKSIGNE